MICFLIFIFVYAIHLYRLLSKILFYIITVKVVPYISTAFMAFSYLVTRSQYHCFFPKIYNTVTRNDLRWVIFQKRSISTELVPVLRFTNLILSTNIFSFWSCILYISLYIYIIDFCEKPFLNFLLF